MKKTSILFLILIAAAIGILITMLGDFNTYSDFETALSSPDRTHTVIGQLVPGTTEYDPTTDANKFSFVKKDEKGLEKKVVSLSEKPQDFERSEQILIKGSFEKGAFIASSMQLKCPSKYQDQAIQNSKNGTQVEYYP
jgi:cytochrome c-type biogenesis protein CcmE